MAIYMKVDWWNGNFLDGNLPETKVMKQKLLTSSHLKILWDFGEGHKKVLAWPG